MILRTGTHRRIRNLTVTTMLSRSMTACMFAVRNPVPKPRIEMVQPIGDEGARFWGDTNSPQTITAS